MAVVVQLSTDSWRHVHRMYSVVQLGPRSFCSVYKRAIHRLKGVGEALAPGGRQKLYNVPDCILDGKQTAKL